MSGRGATWPIAGRRLFVIAAQYILTGTVVCGAGARAETAITMDADLSHNPDLLPQMVGLAQRYDVVIGSRLAEAGGLEGLRRARWLFSVSANIHLRLMLDMKVSNFTSGLRAYERRAFQALLAQPICGRGHSALPELLLRARRSGFRIGEIPIRFRRRHLGKSKVSVGAIAESLLVPWRVRFRYRREAAGATAAPDRQPGADPR